MQKLLLVCCHSENRATSQIWKVFSNIVFPPIWGGKMASFWACACKLSWTFLSPARVEPLYGAGRKESSGTGLSQSENSIRDRTLVDLYLSVIDVFSVFFFKFNIWLKRLSSKTVSNNSIRFLNWRAEENLAVNKKDNRVFMSRNYRSDSCPLEIWFS